MPLDPLISAHIGNCWPEERFFIATEDAEESLYRYMCIVLRRTKKRERERERDQQRNANSVNLLVRILHPYFTLYRERLQATLSFPLSLTITRYWIEFKPLRARNLIKSD